MKHQLVNINTGIINGVQEMEMDLENESEIQTQVEIKIQNKRQKEQGNQREQQTDRNEQSEAVKQPEVVPIPISASDILPAAHSALSLASMATKLSFSLARQSTRLGFAIPRTIFSTLVPSQLSPLSSLIESSLNLAEFSAITAIQLADAISANSLQLASSSISGVDQLCRAYSYPDLPSLDALKLVLVLIRRHWGRLVPAELPGHPPGEMGPFKLLQTLKALSTWALLQQLTQHIQARKLAPSLVHVHPRPATSAECLSETNEDDTEMVLRKFQRYIDLCLSSYGGLGHVLFGSPHPPPPQDQRHTSNQSAPASQAGPGPPAAGPPSAHASGVPQPPSPPSSVHSDLEDSRLFPGSLVLDQSAPVDLPHPPSTNHQSSTSISQSHKFKLWDLLTGKHDHDLLRQYGEVFEETDLTDMGSEDGASLVKELQTMMGDETGEGGIPSSGDEQITLDWEKPPAGGEEEGDGDRSDGETVEWDFVEEGEGGEVSWTVGPCQTSANARPRPPRYFILLDRPNKTVILCLRGTFSIDDLATDLTCESTLFDPILYWDEPCWKKQDLNETTKVRQTFEVHSGFKRVAEELISGSFPPSQAPLTGDTSGSGSSKRTRLMRSIWNVLGDAANKSKDGSVARKFDKLEIVGHSLGAGVGTLLGLMWADPRTGLSTKKGGLPSGIEVRVYGICPPCTTSKELTKIDGPMIKSLVNSMDLISRLSLGHVLDLRTLVGWIQFYETRPDALVEQVEGSGSGGGIWRRLLEIYGKRLGGMGGTGADGALELDDRWMMALRDRLESKTDQAELLVPTGTIYWIRQDELVKVKNDKNEEVFRMIEFDSSMLRDHLGGRVKSQFERFMNLSSSSSSSSDQLETATTRVGSTGGSAVDGDEL